MSTCNAQSKQNSTLVKIFSFQNQIEVSNGMKHPSYPLMNSNQYKNPTFSKDLSLRSHAKNLSQFDEEASYKNSYGVSCLPPPCFFYAYSQNQEMGVSARQNDLLKVVHPGRHVQVFRQPITAGEIMMKYPRHCIARPDVFEFPWIVVHPESVLAPGEVFYLVPYRTIHDLLKAKRQQNQPLVSTKHNQSSKAYNHDFLKAKREQNQPLLSSKHNHSSKFYNHEVNNTMKSSPTKSLAGVTPKHQQHGRYYKTQSYHRNVNDQESYIETQGQDSDNGSLYKLAFYKTWNTIRRNLNHPQESYYDQLDSGLDDSPFDSSIGWPCTSPENGELLRLKPCLRKPGSANKKLNINVSFASPVEIPVSQRGSPSGQQDTLVLKV